MAGTARDVTVLVMVKLNVATDSAMVMKITTHVQKIVTLLVSVMMDS